MKRMKYTMRWAVMGMCVCVRKGKYLCMHSDYMNKWTTNIVCQSLNKIKTTTRTTRIEFADKSQHGEHKEEDNACYTLMGSTLLTLRWSKIIYLKNLRRIFVLEINTYFYVLKKTEFGWTWGQMRFNLVVEAFKMAC